MVHKAIKVSNSLEKDGYNVGVIDLYRLKPLNVNLLIKLLADTEKLLIIEDNIPSGGLCEKVSAALFENDCHLQLKKICIKEEHLFQYNKSRELVEKYCGLGVDAMIDYTKNIIEF